MREPDKAPALLDPIWGPIRRAAAPNRPASGAGGGEVPGQAAGGSGMRVGSAEEVLVVLGPGVEGHVEVQVTVRQANGLLRQLVHRPMASQLCCPMCACDSRSRPSDF